MNVRRFAAIDMHGLADSTSRRRLILSKFILGATLSIVLGAFVFLTADSLFWTVFGLWLIGIGFNYVPLAVYAIGFTPTGALQRELAGVDIPTELQRYAGLQTWVFLPLVLVYLAIRQR
jgi:hypothetical protein